MFYICIWLTPTNNTLCIATGPQVTRVDCPLQGITQSGLLERGPLQPGELFRSTPHGEPYAQMARAPERHSARPPPPKGVPSPGASALARIIPPAQFFKTKGPKWSRKEDDSTREFDNGEPGTFLVNRPTVRP